MAADSTCSLKFGPEWIRALSDSSSGQTPQPPPTQATPPRKYPLAKHRYGKEELIAIYEQTLYGDSIPPLSTPGFVYCDGVYIEQSQTPRSLIPMTDEEQRLWASQRVASSRGRGRGITPALWAAPRTLGGHLQQTRNWRSPEKPMSAGGGGSQSAMSTSSQFNYWRKNSLNEDEKVPEWADEKVSEDNDNVGSFDEKGGFLSLESRGRTVDSVGGVSASGNSFLQRSLSGTESEPNVTTTPASLRSGTESNVTKTLNDKPPSPPLPPAATERDAGFPKRERSRDLDEKEPNDIPAGNGIPCAAGVNAAPPVSRVVEDARSSLGQNKRAQVVILGGAGTLNSIPTVSGADQEVTTAVASARPLQQNSQWASTNRDISEAPLWYYKDPQGIIQGPFSSADMLEWSNQGYFHDSLECRRACDHVFNPLGALKKVWSGTLPFYMPNLHGPISSHLHSVSASTPSAVFNVSNVSMGLGVNPLNASQTLNGFVAPVSAASVAVSSVSRIDALTSELCSESAYYEETSSQFTALTQRQNDFDARNRQIPNDGDAGSEAIGIGHTAVPSRVQLEPELREIESSIRRSVHDLPFNQTVNNHMTVSSDTTSNHRRGIISNRLIEDVSSAVNTRSTAAPTLEQQADSWFSRSPSSSNMAYHRGEMIPPSVNPVVDPTVAPHRTITQHELPNSWLVQRKNERNAEGIQKSSTHHDGTEHVAVNEGSWNDFEYGDSRIMRRSSRPIPIVDMNEPSPQPQPQPQQQQQQRPEQLQPQPAKTPELEPPEDGLHTQSKQQQQIPDEAPFEKVAEKKKKRDRKEKDKQREERLSREKQERDEDQRKQLAQQHSSDEEAEWDSGEQSASGKLSSYQDVIIPAPAPAVPAWGNTQDKAMSALSLQEIQRLEEERASKERQQRQQEAVKNGYYTGIRTWANAIAPTKSFDQIQKEQQASKISAVQNKTQSKSNPTSYTPLSAADVVANGIGGAPTAKSSSSKNTVKMSTVQAVRNNVGGSHVNNNNSNNNNNNGSGSNNNHHHTINNNGGDKPVVASETTNNEQQLIDWCAQITKGLNSYLDMPTVVSILKDVESEAEIEDYVSQFFGESLKEPRQFARQFVQKRAKFNVGLASSLPKQSEWCTTGGNKKRKGAKK